MAILWLGVVIKLQEAESVLSCRCPQNHREGTVSLGRTLAHEILGLQWARVEIKWYEDCTRQGRLIQPARAVSGPSKWATLTYGKLKTQIYYSLYFCFSFQSLLYFHWYPLLLPLKTDSLILTLQKKWERETFFLSLKLLTESILYIEGSNIQAYCFRSSHTVSRVVSILPLFVQLSWAF